LTTVTETTITVRLIHFEMANALIIKFHNIYQYSILFMSMNNYNPDSIVTI